KGAQVGTHIHAIHKQSYRWLHRGNGTVEAHATNGKVHATSESARIIQAHIGHTHADISQVCGEHRFNLFATDSRNGNGNTLRPLGSSTLARCHQYLFDHGTGRATPHRLPGVT